MRLTALIQATQAMYDGRVMDAYKYFLAAGDDQLAHDLAIEYLAPEAVIMHDMALLERLFKDMDPSSITGWHERGHVSPHHIAEDLAVSL